MIKKPFNSTLETILVEKNGLEIDIGCRFSFKTISFSLDLSLLAEFLLLKKAFSDTVEMQSAHHVPNSNTVN